MTESIHDLGKALLKAQQAIAGGVAKEGSRAGLPYKYASVEDMVGSARSVLLDNGLLWTLRPDGESGKSWSIDSERGVLMASFQLEHPESGGVRHYSFEMPVDLSREGDKHTGGGLSYIDKEALRMLLQIPRPDSNDPDHRTTPIGDTRRKASPPKRQRKAASDPAVDALRKEVRALAERYKKETGATFDDVCKDAFDGKTLTGIPTKAELETLKVFLQAANASIDGREIIYDQQEAAQETFGDDQPGF